MSRFLTPGRLAPAVLLLAVVVGFFRHADDGAGEVGPGASVVDPAALRAAAQGWVGVPHRIGGRSRAGIDCSGLALELLPGYGLPRRAEDMRRHGTRVRGPARAGDLVFFRTARADGLRGHVGVMLDSARFVHATASRGVVVSELWGPYWGPRLLEVRRVEVPDGG